jgi:hypothetical protein
MTKNGFKIDVQVDSAQVQNLKLKVALDMHEQHQKSSKYHQKDSSDKLFTVPSLVAASTVVLIVLLFLV